MDKNYDIIIFFSENPYFKKAWSSHFADRIVTSFIKTIIQDSRKVKRIVNYVSNVAKFADFW